MSGLATRRLIDAAAKLEPADRALLDLWVHRGLDDERLTGLTGMSIEALQARRAKIVDQLSAELRVPERDVRGALEQIFPDDGAAIRRDAGRESPSQADPRGAGRPRHRRRLWLGLGALVVIVAVAIVIASGAGSSSPTPRRASATSVPRTTAQGAAVGAASPSRAPVADSFAGLPGGLLHGAGSVTVTGPTGHLTLNLTVRGLPTVHAGQYEVWLYNSVLDSTPLGRLRSGHPRLTAALPNNARHYRWIDISLQPLGAVNHSGESEVRARNPVHAP